MSLAIDDNLKKLVSKDVGERPKSLDELLVQRKTFVRIERSREKIIPRIETRGVNAMTPERGTQNSWRFYEKPGECCPECEVAEVLCVLRLRPCGKEEP